MSNKDFVLKAHPDAKCESKQGFAILGKYTYWQLHFSDWELTCTEQARCWELAAKFIRNGYKEDENERTT